MAGFFVWTATRKTAASTFLHSRPLSTALSPKLTYISSATTVTCGRELYSVHRSSRKNSKREEGGHPKALLFRSPGQTKDAGTELEGLRCPNQGKGRCKKLRINLIRNKIDYQILQAHCLSDQL